ncbi:MAG: hypothetical protein IPK61_04330 [Saprospiraceae bacterium]|nr:hypothetical protein [Saprospiraceae bacterium]
MQIEKNIKNLCHTITLDNGKENADHQTLAKALNTKIYFAHPYSLMKEVAMKISMV